ncbi:MAG: c-type cytochrome [Campylobacterota bacterium]
MKKTIFAALTAALFTTASFAADGEALYGKCAACHGANGEKVALGKSKVIKDMSKEDFVAAMQGYKDGTYGGAMKSMMMGQVATLNKEQIEAIADYIVK